MTTNKSKLALYGGKPVFPRTHRWPRWPQPGAADRRRLDAVLRDGQYGIGAPIIDEFAASFAAYTKTKYALPVNTGTAALELIVKALGIVPGDEVIVPAYTFIASATCVLELGATVVFADIHPQTLNIDPASVARLITSRTRAIVVVHFGGNPADIVALKKVIGKRNIAIIEDAAHAHGMLYRRRAAGHHGVAAEYSFQSSKNMASGEGGILVTNDRKIYEQAWSYHSFGRRPGRAWYEHYVLSWNHRMTAFQAAVLLSELERLEQQTVKRHANGAFLNRVLGQIPGIQPQLDGDTHPRTRRAYHLYMFRYNAQTTGLDRAMFLKALEAEGVPCSGGYPTPLTEAPMFRERRYWHSHYQGGGPRRRGEPDYGQMATPHAKCLCAEAIWLPHKLLLGSRADMQRIVEAMAKVITHGDR